MKQQIGRFVVLPNGTILGGILPDKVKPGYVYTIEEDMFGSVSVSEVGESQVKMLPTEEVDCGLAVDSPDRLLGKARGRHCYVDGEEIPREID